MTGSTQSRFLDRESYRKKRLIDASKLLPLLGALGFILPFVYLFTEEDAQRSPGQTAIYLFVAWLVLILCAGYLAPRMRDAPKSD
jgi:hypothetical protein